MRCLIVDDEPLAHSVLLKYIEKLPDFEIVGNCYSAFEAVTFLKTREVDIMFLDIKMPDLTGFRLLKTLNTKPHVILTTAYSEFALESYEYAVTDYLLKPFSFDRFLTAINKIKHPGTSDPKTGIDTGQSPKRNYIFLKTEKLTYKVAFSEIMYIQSYGNYLKVFTQDQRIMIYEKISSFEKKLPAGFIRIHKSYIIPIDKIDVIEGNQITIGSEKIPIGNFYKSNFLSRIKDSSDN